MALNMSSGKTEAVLMYRGVGASQRRTCTFDRDDCPSLIVPTQTHILTLRIVAAYKNLGARFHMDADLDQEISARIGSARQAFDEVKRPVFLNKSIPVWFCPGSSTDAPLGLMSLLGSFNVWRVCWWVIIAASTTKVFGNRRRLPITGILPSPPAAIFSCSLDSCFYKIWLVMDTNTTGICFLLNFVLERDRDSYMKFVMTCSG